MQGFAGQEASKLFLDEDHPTAEGHRQAAKALAEVLKPLILKSANLAKGPAASISAVD